MRWGVVTCVACVFIASGMYGFGANLPGAHLVTLEARYARPIEAAWDAATDYEAMPEWSSLVVAAERRPEKDGAPVWRFTDGRGRFMDVRIVRDDALKRVYAEALATDMPFRGSWNMEFAETKEGSRVILAEEGRVKNPFRRFALHFLLGEDAKARRYLMEMGRRLGVPASVRSVE